ncbi:MAG TPA: hypothetical protein VHF87_07165 [Methylomirabilota bacterium]|jgi:hypothetical protein|nr:hypothetical protein [Methylomirabilota bacterium]
MRRRGVSRLLLNLVGSVLLAAGVAEAQGGGIERFFGTYVGEAISESGDELDKRDINAEVTSQGKGFKVKFTVVVKRGKDKPRRDEYTIVFTPSRRTGIYSSAMRTDVFGNAVPLDPIAGDPYMWARLDGDKFWRYALFVTETGGYEMQTYEYTLVPGGLALRYSRIRDGEVLRTVTGKLKKVR